jgi:hypothetical protein
MVNMLFGLRALLGEVYGFFGQLTHYQLFWGFSMGFFVSTLIHGFLFVDHPRQVPSVLFQDPAVSFQALHRPDASGYQQSYYAFTRVAQKTKMIFAMAGLLFLFIVTYTVLHI